jgi:hypothetical protein
VDPTVVENGKFFNLPGLELRPLGCPARSQSLYRLLYPGSFRGRKYIRKRLQLVISPCTAGSSSLGRDILFTYTALLPETCYM